MTDRELMQQALEALNRSDYLGWQLNIPIIKALRERLAQPEQEPAAYTTGHCENHKQKGGCQLHNLQCGWPACDRKPITTPPQRKPLTDEEMFKIAEIAWRHGWASCCNAEYIGEEAEDERWGMVGAEVVQDIAAHGIKGKTHDNTPDKNLVGLEQA